MSLPIKFYTVIVRESVITAKVDGGPPRLREQMKGIAEAGLIRWVCMSPGDVDLIVNRLEHHGLTLPATGPDADIAVLDMMRGLLSPCTWLEVLGADLEPKRVRLALQLDLYAEPSGGAAQSGSGLAALLEYVRKDARICPMPIPWNNFWQRLEAAAGSPAPRPLILSGWVWTSDLRKKERLQEQIEWADRLGLVWVADQILRGLKADEWHAPDMPTLADPEPWEWEPEEDEE